MSNMFNDLFRSENNGNMNDVDGQLVLVETTVGLTNYSHPPALRAPDPYMPSVLLDELVGINKSEGVSESQLKHYAAHLSGLSTTPNDMATIRNGFSEYNKGMMKLKFCVQSGGIRDDYVSVIGYITDNDLEGELSENAWFTPVFSWKHQKIARGGVGLDGLCAVREEIGMRTDYLLNDGSQSQSKGLASVRPGDVMGNASDNIAYEDTLKQANLEDVVISPSINTTSTGAINQVGVVCSNRKNYNPTKYSEALLGGAINAQQKLMLTGHGDGDRMTTMYNSEMGIISDITANMLSKESRAAHDDFLHYMKELNGSTTYRGFRGWQVKDIVCLFPNFAETIPANGFSTMDRNRFEVIDFTQIAQVFGTSSVVEVIAQQLVFNILDVLVHNGLGALNIEGSNCDYMATEDRLSNIVLIPSTPAALGDDDFLLAPRQIAACDQLRNQIFNKLNGSSVYTMTPVRIYVESELFGFTQIWISSPSEEDMEPRTIHYAFPTYAPSPWSPVFSDVETANQLSKSVYGNIKSYFIDDY